MALNEVTDEMVAGIIEEERQLYTTGHEWDRVAKVINLSLSSITLIVDYVH